MHKIALIGGKSIHKYTVADQLWKLLSEVSGINFEFTIIPLSSKDELNSFYAAYRKDVDFVGFNVALPWKNSMARLVGSEKRIINTVYKNRGSIVGDNTDPMGVERGFKTVSALLQNSKVLILGAGGGGVATANYLINRGALVHIYDIEHKKNIHKIIQQCESMEQVMERRYDLIINATPLGKYYFGSVIDSFSTPIDAEILKVISHNQTIVQEMNYMPIKTLLLQIADTLGLRTVPGMYMLVFQAIESLSRYFNVTLPPNKTKLIVEAMNTRIAAVESDILSISNK